MSDNQLRVLWILIAAIAINVLFSTSGHAIWTALSTGNLNTLSSSEPLAQQLTAPVAAIVLYIIGLVLFLLLADEFPTITTWTAALILTAVVFRHGGDISNLLGLATSGLASLQPSSEVKR